MLLWLIATGLGESIPLKFNDYGKSQVSPISYKNVAVLEYEGDNGELPSKTDVTQLYFKNNALSSGVGIRQASILPNHLYLLRAIKS